jgi:carbon storage regulator CsrA
MLVLTRRPGETLILHTSDGPIVVELCRIVDRRAKVGIEAPTTVRVLREELLVDKTVR